MSTSRTTRRTGTRPATTTKPLRSGYGAEDGLAQMKKEAARSDQRREAAKQRAKEPRRYWMKEGETRQLVIVDERIEFFRYEHALQDPKSKRFDTFTPCVNEHANCPVCKMADAKPSYFAAYLTVIDLTPYEKDDGEVIEWSKRLLVIKPAQQKKYARLQEREGTLRGMIIEVTRDKKTDANIGNDVEFVEFMEEDELLGFETVYEDKDGKEHEIIGHEPFDYWEAFPEWTEKQLQAVAGGSPSVGNRSADNKSLGRRTSSRDHHEEEDEEQEEQAPRRAGRDSSRSGSHQAAPASRAGTRSASRRTPREEPEEEQEEYEEEAYEEEEVAEEQPRRPARSGSRTTSRPAARGSRRQEPEEEEDLDPPFEMDEEEEEEPEEKPARRTGTRPASRAQSREPEEDRPQRQPSRSGGTADRRAALRERGRR